MGSCQGLRSFLADQDGKTAQPAALVRQADESRNQNIVFVIIFTLLFLLPSFDKFLFLIGPTVTVEAKVLSIQEVDTDPPHLP
jgi:hypothetical protein